MNLSTLDALYSYVDKTVIELQSSAMNHEVRQLGACTVQVWDYVTVYQALMYGQAAEVRVELRAYLGLRAELYVNDVLTRSLNPCTVEELRDLIRETLGRKRIA